MISKILKLLPNRIIPFVLKSISKIDGGVYYSSILRNIFEDLYGIKVGYGSYGSCFKINSFPKGTKIGNYCSFGSNIKAFNANHPIEQFTSHPIIYNPRCNTQIRQDLLIRNKLTIGHDVWIGDGVKIMPNVTNIGNGAIIGAGSIVTKNVNPYTVNVGNPCKEIKSRFSTEFISEIEKSKWWELKKEDLIKTKYYLETITYLKLQRDKIHS